MIIVPFLEDTGLFIYAVSIILHDIWLYFSPMLDICVTSADWLKNINWASIIEMIRDWATGPQSCIISYKTYFNAMFLIASFLKKF